MAEPVVIGSAALYLGDCLEALRTLPDASVDSVVADPPAGIGFMGKDWDHHKGGRDQWVAWMTDVAAECLRVLKPGGHALVWAIPRTSHWTATALEDAGFEIRDRIAHVFSTGFPKSMDVSKAIDKAAGAERYAIPGTERRGRTGEAAQPNGGSVFSDDNYQWPKTYSKTAPATEAAKQWEGWGTALKPAMEDWWLCRKSLTGTVAQNVMEHGTGALNIDASRVPQTGESKQREGEASQERRYTNNGAVNIAATPGVRGGAENGRFPANLIHDGSTEVLELFPDSKSCNSSSAAKPQSKFRPGQGNYLPQGKIYPGETGSAARFFYCAKARKADRGQCNRHPTVKATELMRYLCRLITPPGGTVLDPFMGSGSTGKAAMLEGFRFIGIEREPEYFAIAQARIENAQRQGRLF